MSDFDLTATSTAVTTTEWNNVGAQTINIPSVWIDPHAYPIYPYGGWWPPYAWPPYYPPTPQTIYWPVPQRLSDEDVDRIADRLAEKLAKKRGK